jgi:hypothetical protein
MWIQFSSRHPYAIKVYTGYINAISGEPAKETGATLLRRQNRKRQGKSVQDYLVIPAQRWLDGFAVANGKVRQFVTMPIGSGHSIESQMLNMEPTGGIQIDITPAVRPLNYWSGLIFVKTLTGKTITITANSESTISEIKQDIQHGGGVHSSRQRLIFASKELEDTFTLRYYKISEVLITSFELLNTSNAG